MYALCILIGYPSTSPYTYETLLELINYIQQINCKQIKYLHNGPVIISVSAFKRPIPKYLLVFIHNTNNIPTTTQFPDCQILRRNDLPQPFCCTTTCAQNVFRCGIYEFYSPINGVRFSGSYRNVSEQYLR